MCEKYKFGVKPINCYAWNKDRSQVALSPNNNDVRIYGKNLNKDWQVRDILNQHSLRVTGIDWAYSTNRIVTCAADRNAYVWEPSEDGKWKPTLVLLRMNRAATCVKWSPDENKFAVGSGAKLVSVCYFEESNNWWISKHITKSIKSTITCLAWHPNNYILVVGSTDFKVRIFTAYIKEIENSPPSSQWSDKSQHGQMHAEYSNSVEGGGWIHSVSFSPDGDKICWVAHDSTICLIDSSKDSYIHKFRSQNLPFLSCVWVSPSIIGACGHGTCPTLFTLTEDGRLKFLRTLSVFQEKEASHISAMKKFQSLDRQASTGIDVNESNIQMSMTSLQIYSEHDGAATKISTCGSDGKIVIWDIPLLENKAYKALIK